MGKWLNAGVMEAGELSYPQRGTPQGGVLSAMLSNVYVHEVLDQWFEHEVKPRLRGRAFEVRYADDAVLVFEHEDDARRVLEVLAKRLEKYGLRLHRDKTRKVECCRPSKLQRGGSQRERSLRIPVKLITDSGVKPITDSGQTGHLSERSDAGLGL